MKHFASLKQELQKDSSPRHIAIQQQSTPGAGTRAAKKTVARHLSAELSKTLNRTPVDKNSSVQALLGEAISICFCASAVSTRLARAKLFT